MYKPMQFKNFNLSFPNKIYFSDLDNQADGHFAHSGHLLSASFLSEDRMGDQS